MNSKLVFCIGNGESRRVIDLEKLRSKGLTIGCNALYRDFHPDYLVAVDQDMISEIQESKYKGDLILMNVNKRDGKRFVSDKSGVIDLYDSWSAGGLALQYAVKKLKANLVYLIGYDFDPEKKIKKYNNMYKDTNCYRTSGSIPQITSNFLRQATQVFEENTMVIFVWVNNNPDDLWNKRNVKVLDIKKFLKQYQCKITKGESK